MTAPGLARGDEPRTSERRHRTRRPLTSTLSLLGDVSGTLPSPRVASLLAEFAQGGTTALRELAAHLRPRQLRGEESLPTLLPFVPAMADEVTLAGATPAERHVLLRAALDLTGDAAVVLDAAAVDAGVLLLGPLQERLSVENGRMVFLDERLRSLIVSEATAAERLAAHADLARATRRAGAEAAALLHQQRGGLGEARTIAQGLVRAAAKQLRRGFAANAVALARGAIELAEPGTLGAARSILGRAAFWNGAFDEAKEHLDPVRDAGLHERIEAIRARPPEDLPPTRRAQAVTRMLEEVADADADQRALALIGRIGDHWHAGEAEDADSLCARLFLSAHAGHDATGWRPGVERLTPLVLAQVHSMEVGLQIHADDLAGAARALADAIGTLPMEHAAAGVVARFIALFADRNVPFDTGLAGHYDRLIGQPESPPYEPDGAVTGERSLAAIRTRRAYATGTREWPATDFSPRQRDVARLLLQGLTNREIGESLGISERTVEVHLNLIYRKAGVRTRAEYLSRAMRTGGAP